MSNKLLTREEFEVEYGTDLNELYTASVKSTWIDFVDEEYKKYVMYAI